MAISYIATAEFFVGGPWWGGYGYYDYGCWQWVPTRWGPQRIWVCGSYY